MDRENDYRIKRANQYVKMVQKKELKDEVAMILITSIFDGISPKEGLLALMFVSTFQKWIIAGGE